MGNINSGITVAGNDPPELISSLHNIQGNNIAMNQGPGIIVSGNVAHTNIGSSLSTDFTLNWIHNNSSGVSFGNLGGLGPRYVSVRKNVFSDHSGKAINIYTLCATCQEQTFPPVITTYEEVDPVTAVITGTHHQAGSKIDIYTANLNLSGIYEGGTWLGSATVDANNDFILTVDNCQCDIVATATSTNGSTSEFTDGETITTSVENNPDFNFSLKASPNPFNETVEISFELKQSSKVELEIFNLDGRKVKSLVNESLQQGNYSINWDAGRNSSGIYYYRLKIDNHHAATGKLVYLK